MLLYHLYRKLHALIEKLIESMHLLKIQTVGMHFKCANNVAALLQKLQTDIEWDGTNSCFKNVQEQ